MADALAYLNGQFVPFSQLSISVADAGFVFGATATEYVRTFGGRLFRLDDHLARLRESCRLCRIPLEASDEEVRAAAERLVSTNLEQNLPSPNPSPKRGGEQTLLPSPPASGGEGMGVRGEGQDLSLIIFATPGPLSHLGGADTGPTLGMHTFPLPFARYKRLFTEGAPMVVPPIRRDSTIDPHAKMRSRLNWWIAEQQAKEIDDQAWALLLDTDGNVTETAAANFLIVRQGAVISPPRESILNGVSLRIVEELCAESKIRFVEMPLEPKDCLSADEAMLTGTAFCLAGVRSINGAEIPWPGAVFHRIADRWSESFGLNYICQFVN